MPATPIAPAERTKNIKYAVRDVLALADEAKARGLDLLHLNIGDPNIYGFSPPAAVAEAALEDRDYLVGDSFTGADIIMTTTMKWAIAYDIELTPRLMEYTNFHAQRPAYRSAGRLTFSVNAGA